MSDRFYLLRNNRESGPFSLGELLQQCLLPGDLVWVEGKSQNWIAPAEVPEIEASLPKGYTLSPSQKPASGVQEHISDRELALRAEGIRRRAMAALYQHTPSLHQGTPRMEMTSAPLHVSEEDAVEIIHHKPARLNGNVAEFMLFCTLCTLAVIGWRSGVFAHLIQVRPQEEVVANRLDNSSNHTATATAVPVQQASALPQQPFAVAAATTDSTQKTDSGARTFAVVPKPRAAVLPRRETVIDTGLVAGEPEKKKPVVAETSVANNEAPKEPVKTAVAPEKKAAATDKPEVTAPRDAEAKTSTRKSEPEAEVKEEKHKGLGLFRGWFKKKKKDEATAETAANPGR